MYVNAVYMYIHVCTYMYILCVGMYVHVCVCACACVAELHCSRQCEKECNIEIPGVLELSPPGTDYMHKIYGLHSDTVAN